MTLRLCVLLWEQPGRGEDLGTFEGTVLGFLPAHGGTVLARDTVLDRHWVTSRVWLVLRK